MAETATAFRYDPFAPEVMANPLEHYRVLRDRFPVYQLPDYDAWALSRFDDIHAVLGDFSANLTTTEGTVPGPQELRRSNGGHVPAPRFPHDDFTRIESPQYEGVRQAVVPPLRPRAVSRLENVIRGLARERLDELVPRTRFNVTAEYGGRVAAAVMCHLAMLPPELAPTVLAAINGGSSRDPVTGGFPAERDQLRAPVFAALMDSVAERRAAGADGSVPLIDGLLRYDGGGRELTDEEIARQLMPVITGGTETAPKVVAHGLMELYLRPDQLAEVRQDLAENCRTAFAEMLRFCAPAQWFMRTVAVPFEIHGTRIERGHRVLMLLASANRDEREFVEPDEFRWDRPIPRHLAFGHGQHFCIGNHLARLEGQLLLEELLARVSRYSIDVDAAVRPPSDFQWGWTQVPFVVEEETCG
jgi:cytochrome P450